MGVLLEVKDINRFFGGLQAVRGVSFTVPEGVIKAIIGPNGAGKTTLFNVICGNLSPTSGSILFRGRAISHLKPFQIAALGISRTFQTTRLFPHMTVLENVMVGRHTRSRTGFLGAMLSLPNAWREESEIESKAMETLGLFGLHSLADEHAGNLPFGLQRRVEFARAISTEPQLVLLDEPAAGLNITETNELAGLIRRIRGWGVTILVVEHDMSLVMGISDEIVVLDEGNKLAEGTPETIQRDPEVIKIYLGEQDASSPES